MSDFIFGTATSAYQIEGAHDRDGRGTSIWDTFSHTPGKTERGETGDTACNHYNMWNQDLDLIRDLGVDAYRFSISWNRIIPDGTGAINYKGVDFYKRLIDGIRDRGLEPWATLFHWDLPQTLQDKGGFANRSVLEWFAEYTDAVMGELGDRLKNIAIINEPCVFATHGHRRGVHAPGLTDAAAYNATVHHLNMVMASAYRQVKSYDGSKSVGSTFPFTIVEPATASEKDALAAEIADAYEHGNYLDPLFFGTYPSISAKEIEPFIKGGDMETIKGQYDFIGIQHYMPFYARYDENDIMKVHRDFTTIKPELPRNSFGWTIEPPVFFKALMKIKDKYGNPPVYVTENGTASFDTVGADGKVHDQLRMDYLSDYLGALFKAKGMGADIRGYFEWSFLDNFEWAAGYDQRFGLVYVDYHDNFRRIPKESYFWYRDYIKKFRQNRSQAA